MHPQAWAAASPPQQLAPQLATLLPLGLACSQDPRQHPPCSSKQQKGAASRPMACPTALNPLSSHLSSSTVCWLWVFYLGYSCSSRAVGAVHHLTPTTMLILSILAPCRSTSVQL